MPAIGNTSTFGMLRAAVRTPAFTSAPSMISAFERPSFSKWPRSALVLASLRSKASITTMPSSFALADSACRSAKVRIFFGRPISWLRGCGPNERPPPRNRWPRIEPWRAPPVPFCRYIFLPVRWTSARPCTACVPARRLANCQMTQRWMMSARGSSPKMASDTVTEPDSLPSREVTFSSISRPLLAFGRRRFRSRSLGELELARLGHAGRQFLLPRAAHGNPAAFDARHRALDQNQAAFDVRLHDLQIERGHPIDTEMAGHFLVLEGLAWILPAAGRTDRAMRDRNTVGGAQTAEIPALHAAGPTLTGRSAGHVDILADEEVIGGDFG